MHNVSWESAYFLRIANHMKDAVRTETVVCILRGSINRGKGSVSISGQHPHVRGTKSNGKVTASISGQHPHVRGSTSNGKVTVTISGQHPLVRGSTSNGKGSPTFLGNTRIFNFEAII
jgi:hypothetical protein